MLEALGFLFELGQLLLRRIALVAKRQQRPLFVRTRRGHGSLALLDDAPRGCVRRSSRRVRRRAMSARIRARSALRAVCECAVVRLMTSTSAAAMVLRVRRVIAQCMPGRLLLRLFFRRSLAARREAADLH